MHPASVGDPANSIREIVFFVAHPGQTEAVGSSSEVMQPGLSDSFVAFADILSWSAEVKRIVPGVKAKRLSRSHVDRIKLIFRPACQFLQMEARIPESRNGSPPKR